MHKPDNAATLVLHTESVDIAALDTQQREWLYCGLDAGVTVGVCAKLLPMIEGREDCAAVYAFERWLQAPAMVMQMRGIRINRDEQEEIVKELRSRGKTLQRELEALGRKLLGGAEWGGFRYIKALAPHTSQVQKLLGLAGITVPMSRDGKPTADRQALERIGKRSPRAKPLCDTLALLRDLEKQIEALCGGLGPDGRMHYMLNVGQTETGRWSSSQDVFKRGVNIQNQDERVRAMYVPDPGWEMFTFDQAQAESCNIAYLAGDEAYIEAHLRGNVHVEAARLFWPGLGRDASGDVAVDKAMLKMTPVPWIKQPPVGPGKAPAASYYDMSKRAQHGLNYGLTKFGLAIWLGCKQEEAARLRAAYFGRFSRLPDYHAWIRGQLKTVGALWTPLGRYREFFARVWDEATVREALAHVPQSLTSDITKIMLARIWWELEPRGLVQLFSDQHDGGHGQWPIARRDEAQAAIAALCRVPVAVTDPWGTTREMVVPVEIKAGRNWRDLK